LKRIIVAKESSGAPSIDGPTLRAIRDSMGIPLRRVARHVGMSHGHLSKVERGEHGRPVTPIILLAYEKTVGVSLTEAAALIGKPGGGVIGRRGRTWRPGEIGDLRRSQFNAAIGALSLGGQLGGTLPRALDHAGAAGEPNASPEQVGAQLQQFADLLAGLDLSYGSSVVENLAKQVLRWAGTLVQTIRVEPEDVPVFAAIAAITHRAAWAAFDQQHHDSARDLLRSALFCAVRAQDHDLRGHIVADVAAQHVHLGYEHDATDVLRIVEGDERMSMLVHMAIYTVRARAYAAAGAAAQCRRQIELAERAYGEADPGLPGWVGRTAAAAGRMPAAAGHALAVLAGITGSAQDRDEAVKHLSEAVEMLDPASHTRARVLCQARLALLHLGAGELESATYCGTGAVQAAQGVHSLRVLDALWQLRAAAMAHPDGSGARELVEALGPAADGAPQATQEPGT
jgi:transcriptional regulator with XRE-family HTH domain